MADLSDVLNSLASIAESAVYPNGTSNPSVAGVDVRIYVGWPVPANLDADLALGKVNVSIYPSPSERPTTRFPINWHESIINPATIILTLTDTTTLTVSGTISTPQTCMVIVNGIPYAYSILPADTLTAIATGIAALIPGASSVGAVVTIAGAYKLVVRVSTAGTGIRELKRQERVITINVWAQSDPLRTSVASAIDVVFSLPENERFVLPDNYYAILKYRGTRYEDMVEKSNLYRRDLMYTVEYPTTITEEQYTIADITANTEIVPEI